MAWLRLLTFSCSAEPVNFSSTCSLWWLLVPSFILLLLLRCGPQLSASRPGCGPSATAGAVWTGRFGHLASVFGWNAAWPGRGHHSGLGGAERAGWAGADAAGGEGRGGAFWRSWCQIRITGGLYLLSGSLWSTAGAALLAVKRHQAATEPAAPMLLRLAPPGLAVNKHSTWYQRCSVASPPRVQRSPLHTKQRLSDQQLCTLEILNNAERRRRGPPGTPASVNTPPSDSVLVVLCHQYSSFILVSRDDDNSSKLLAVNMCVSHSCLSVPVVIISAGRTLPSSKWWAGTQHYHQLICHNHRVHFQMLCVRFVF